MGHLGIFNRGKRGKKMPKWMFYIALLLFCPLLRPLSTRRWVCYKDISHTHFRGLKASGMNLCQTVMTTWERLGSAVLQRPGRLQQRHGKQFTVSCWTERATNLIECIRPQNSCRPVSQLTAGIQRWKKRERKQFWVLFCPPSDVRTWVDSGDGVMESLGCLTRRFVCCRLDYSVLSEAVSQQQLQSGWTAGTQTDCPLEAEALWCVRC